VITVAAGFPTTVNPIIQNQLTPVFVDIELPSYGSIPRHLEQAVGRAPSDHRGAYVGNPFNLDAVADVAKRHNLWLIEDNCDALGSRYRGRLTGTFGDLSTISFYPRITLPWARVAPC